MRDCAVVALEVVLDADLPVRLVLGLRSLEEDERIDVDAAVGDDARKVAEVVGERLGVRVGIDEDEGPPRVDGERHEPELLAVEAGLRVGARRIPEGAVEVVRPRVVGALERLPLPRRVAEDVGRGVGTR